MSKAHSNKGRFFSFPNARVMDNFINLFDDLFTPYSEEVVKYERIFNDYGTEMDLRRGFKVIGQAKKKTDIKSKFDEGKLRRDFKEWMLYKGNISKRKKYLCMERCLTGSFLLRLKYRLLYRKEDT